MVDLRPIILGILYIFAAKAVVIYSSFQTHFYCCPLNYTGIKIIKYFAFLETN